MALGDDIRFQLAIAEETRGSNSLPRGEDGYDRSGVAAIGLEIRIRGPNPRIRVNFRHSDHAGVGEIHGSIRVFVEEFPDCGSLLLEIERTSEQAIAVPDGERFEGSGQFPEQVHGFRQNGLAGEEGRAKLLEALQRPFVVDIRAIQQSHQRPGINQKVAAHTLRPKLSKCFLLVERSPALLVPM